MQSSAPTKGALLPEPAELVDLIVASLDDDKAEVIASYDVRGRSSVADFIVVANGRSARHVKALADHVMEKLRAVGVGRVKAEGTTTCDWVLVDAGDVIIHLFRPEVRDFYGLDRIWAPGPQPS